MTNDNDLLLLALSASPQNNGTYKVYIDSSGHKTLTPQTHNWEAADPSLRICCHSKSGTVYGLLAGKNPKKVIFPNCFGATGYKTSGAFYMAFEDCTSLTSVSFPALTTATGGDTFGAFYSAFEGCTSLTSVSFPVLKTAEGAYKSSGITLGAFDIAFQNCTSLTSVSFPALTTATGNNNYGAFGGAFQNCTSLTSISFPSLTTVGTKTKADVTFRSAFSNCSPSLKVHFKKSMKGKPGLDYKTMGLTSADQVVFDLP